MSNFEIALIVMACAVPVVALLMVLPKIKLKVKKKEKKEKEVESTKTLADVKKEEPKEEVALEKPKEAKNPVMANEISDDDFKTYLSRRKPISKPSRIDLPDDYVDRTTPYMPRRISKQENKPKNIKEEIQNLSPKLKAMLIAGVLDKKDLDE